LLDSLLKEKEYSSCGIYIALDVIAT